jgi:hypothetical protein
MVSCIRRPACTCPARAGPSLRPEDASPVAKMLFSECLRSCHSRFRRTRRLARTFHIDAGVDIPCAAAADVVRTVAGTARAAGPAKRPGGSTRAAAAVGEGVRGGGRSVVGSAAMLRGPAAALGLAAARNKRARAAGTSTAGRPTTLCRDVHAPHAPRESLVHHHLGSLWRLFLPFEANEFR